MLTEMGFIRNSCDESLYTRTEPKESAMLIVAYVDYMLLAKYY